MTTKRPPQQQQLVRATQVSFQGPLPPSSELAAYEQVYPGAAKVVFKMAEDHGAHVRALEVQSMQLTREREERNRVALNANIAITTRNQYFAFVTILAGMGMSAYLITLGQTTTGVGLLLLELGSLGGLFIWVQHKDAGSPKNKT